MPKFTVSAGFFLQRIIHKIIIPWDKLLKLVTYLQKLGLLGFETASNTFIATEKGLEFARSYVRFQDLLK